MSFPTFYSRQQAAEILSSKYFQLRKICFKFVNVGWQPGQQTHFFFTLDNFCILYLLKYMPFAAHLFLCTGKDVD